MAIRIRFWVVLGLEYRVTEQIVKGFDAPSVAVDGSIFEIAKVFGKVFRLLPLWSNSVLVVTSHFVTM